MLTCRLHIVALTHYEVGTTLDTFYAEGLGRSMTLRPEPTNSFDPCAIRAYDWQGRHVGYVAGSELRDAWLALRGSGRHSLRGRIAAMIEQHNGALFEGCVEILPTDVELFPQGPFLEWTYTGPELKPTQQMLSLEYMMDELEERLDERERWDETQRDDFLLLGERFCSLSRYDLSGDMEDFRRRLSLRLEGLADDAFASLTENLRLAFGRTGRDAHDGDVLDYWMRVLTGKAAVRQLLTHRRHYDAAEVRRQLEAFPEGMYETWTDDREHFVSRLLYLHVPREVLWRLVSGIAFCETATAADEGKRTATTDSGQQQTEPTTEGSAISLPSGLPSVALNYNVTIDNTKEKTVIPNVSNYQPQIQTQHVALPDPAGGRQERKQIESE